MESQPIEILLVEDNDADADLALHALQKSKVGNRIKRVADGEEALDYLFCRGAFSDRSFDAAPRLVLLDLKLPKVDGLQILRELKADPRTKSIPIVLLTASREERDLVDGYQIGVNSYIQKPVNFDQFRDVVRQLGLYWLLINARPPVVTFSSH
jgi:two-component system, response regulator